MSETVSIQKIGEEYGLILPARHLDRVGWKEGDLVEIHSDAVHIEFVEPHFRDRRYDREERRRDDLIARETMRKYYAALRQLARSER